MPYNQLWQRPITGEHAKQVNGKLVTERGMLFLIGAQNGSTARLLSLWILQSFMPHSEPLCIASPPPPSLPLGPTLSAPTLAAAEDRSSCDNTEFGCCPDGRTPASTPEGANCPCKSNYPPPLFSLTRIRSPKHQPVCLLRVCVCVVSSAESNAVIDS